MEFPQYSDEEVLMREINGAEKALAQLHQAGFCECLIDPTMTLEDRIIHLGKIGLLMAAELSQLRGARAADSFLDSLGNDNLEN